MFGTQKIRITDFPFRLQAFFSRSRSLSLLIGNIWFGVNQIDRDLWKFLKTNKGYFVELGANDGLNQSNTKHLELFRGGEGVLIEPFPKNFERISNNRSPRSKFVNAACVSFNFLESEMLLRYSNLMTTPLQGESDVLDRSGHAKLGADFLHSSEAPHTFKAKALTLTKILDDCGAPQLIDLLSLDVEGGELEVLKGVDHTKYRFSWIIIESRSPKALSDYLQKVGYSLVSKLSVHDYLFQQTLQKSGT